MAWAEAWQKTKYQQPPMMELVGQTPLLDQNPGSFLNYKQKKRQKKRRRIIKKEARSLQNMDMYFDYSPTSDKGRTIIFLLTFEKLHNSTI
jgi:hypothetical protein